MKILKQLFFTGIIGTALLTSSLNAKVYNLSSGSKKGVFAPIGNVIAKTAHKTGLKVRNLYSQGTLHNISRAKHGHKTYGEVDLIIADPSVMDKFRTKIDFEKVGETHTEDVHIICNDKSGVDDVGDLESGEKTLATGFKGSNNKIIFENWQKEDDDYKATTTVSIGGDYALEAVINGEVDCMMYTAGIKSKTMQKVDSNSKGIHIIKVNDGDFDDYESSKGERLYFESEIPAGTYKNLQAGMLWGSNATETISVNAALYMRASLPESVKSDIKTAFKLAKKQLRKKYRYEKN